MIFIYFTYYFFYSLLIKKYTIIFKSLGFVYFLFKEINTFIQEGCSINAFLF